MISADLLFWIFGVIGLAVGVSLWIGLSYHQGFNHGFAVGKQCPYCADRKECDTGKSLPLVAECDKFKRE